MTDESNFVTALIVQGDGTKHVTKIEANGPNGLATLQSLVGGSIEFVHVAPGVHVYINEEGKFLPGLLYNETATDMLDLCPGDFIMGDAVFLGEGEDGNEGDLPTEWLEENRG